MRHSLSDLRFWVLPLCLFAGSCTNDSGDDGKPSTGTGSSYGRFEVSLKEAMGTTPAYASVLGQTYDGPTPSSLIWEEVAKSGSCRVLKPVVPHCDLPCGSQAACVGENKCQDFPAAISVGKVKVTGVRTKSGAASFAMDTLLGAYQPIGALLDFPPFAEGDALTFSAAGGDSIAPFTLTAPGISPFEPRFDSLVLEDGKPVLLEWAPPARPENTTVSVLVDISHHGGAKGKIECEAPDTGKLEIAATLVDRLKALGVSGFPKIEVARKSIGTNPATHVDLVVESGTTQELIIPGLISCEINTDCPSGQTCQGDKQCK